MSWIELNSTQLNSTQLNLTQLNLTQLNSTQFNSTQLNSTQLNSTQRNSTQLNATQLTYDVFPERIQGEDLEEKHQTCLVGVAAQVSDETLHVHTGQEAIAETLIKQLKQRMQ